MKLFSRIVATAFLATTLVSVTGCSPTPKRETVQYLEDSDVNTKVKAALNNDTVTKNNDIHVATFNGVVQLSGYVGSQAAIDRAVELALAASGVKRVTNDMRLK